MLAAIVLAALWSGTPGVKDAERRTVGRLAAFDARDAALPKPDLVGQAVVATEDSRFYSHHGIDTVGVLRASIGRLRGVGEPGGATLDQQLAKVLYTPTPHGLATKVEQLVLALKLEATYPKARILEMYLNAVYYGHGYYGLPAASHGYFGRSPAQLGWGQASLLAGLVQAPSAYDPLRHLDRARQREQHVLDRLVSTGVLSNAQARAAYEAPLGLVNGTA